MQIALFIISILPVIALLWFFEKQDKGRKEPKKLVRKVFWWGVISTIFAGTVGVFVDEIWFALNLPNIAYIFLTSFITAALIEEAFKLFVVKKFAYNNEHFNEVMDGITYAIVASLGFAALENILYVMDGGLAVGLIRAVISVPAHALFSGVMGYYIGKARFLSSDTQRRNIILKGYFFAVLYHGLFNFFLFTQNLAFIVLIVPLLITMILHLRQKIRQAHFEDKVNLVAPLKFTFKSVVKVFIVSILVILATGNVLATIFYAENKAFNYTNEDILYSAIFALIVYFICYLAVRKKKAKMIEPRKVEERVSKN